MAGFRQRSRRLSGLVNHPRLRQFPFSEPLGAAPNCGSWKGGRLPNLATFLAGRQRNGRPVPFFIVRDFRAYLDCGKILDCLGMPIRAPPTAPALIEDWGGDDVNDTPVYSEAYA